MKGIRFLVLWLSFMSLFACVKKPCEKDCVSECGVYNQCDKRLVSPYGKSPCYQYHQLDCSRTPDACAERKRGDYWGCKKS